MNLQSLFETQKILDDRIVEQHGLRGQDLLPEKILALQVELGELANEWRGFKFWSEDREPRTSAEIECGACIGTGDSNAEANMEMMMEGQSGNPYEPCEDCGETGIAGYRNPLLEEYVDCLHFLLSIGNEYGLHTVTVYSMKSNDKIKYTISRLMSLVHDFQDHTHRSKNVVSRLYGAIFSVFIGLGETLGFSWQQIEEAYYAKNKINHTQQATGY